MHKKTVAIITIIAIAILIAITIAMTQVSARSGGISGRSQSGCGGEGCHFDNTFTPDVEVRIENLPSEYTPNTQYTITIKVVNGPSGNQGGFDLNVDKGTLSVQSGDTNVQIDNGEATHTNPDHRQWNVVWTSPSANSGDATFYVAGISVNGNGGTTGDGWALNATTINEGDSQLPTITITSPLNNSVLNTTSINVQGTASDNIGLQKVEISKDNVNWILCSGKENWQGNLILDIGINTIYAKATDTSNNYNISSIIVNVSANTLGTLNGYVYYEKYGEYIPIENATVLIDGTTYYTDIIGFFKINLQEGNHTIFFSKNGFYTNSTEITIVKNTTLWIYSLLLENIEPNNVSINVLEKTFNSINISWNEVVENAFANYTIFISEHGNLGNLLKVITSKNATNYNISGLDENIVYYITVRVYDNYTKFNDTTITVKTLNDYPEKIELSVYGTTQNSINLIWQKSNENDFASYTIFMSETNGTLGNILISLDNKTTESYNATNLKEDTLYYFTLRVYDIYGLFTDSTQYQVRTSGFPIPTYTLELINGSVSPLNGDTETSFKFSVIYINSDNNKPIKIQVIIDNTSYEMEEVDSEDKNYKDGKEYFYETTLEQGAHNYTFYATDGKLNFTSQKGMLGVIEKKQETGKGFLPGFEFVILIGAILFIISIRRKTFHKKFNT